MSNPARQRRRVFGPSPTRLCGAASLAVALLCLAAPCAGCARGGPAPQGFLALSHAHPTRLTRRAPAQPRIDTVEVPAGVQAVRYASQGRALRAFLWLPQAPAQAAPAVVYLHGNFRFEQANFEHVRPLHEAGYAVLMPTWRGEQGNPGHFELLRGELDDAVAAVRWLARQPGIDPASIHAVGHSVGGALSALLSLVRDVPLQTTASVGGIYVPETFVRWSRMPNNRHLVRFDIGDRRELELRVLGPNLRYMRRPHVAYVGKSDRWFLDNVRRVAARARELGRPFRFELVEGDHMSSLGPALAAFLRAIEAPTTPGAGSPGDG